MSTYRHLHHTQRLKRKTLRVFLIHAHVLLARLFYPYEFPSPVPTPRANHKTGLFPFLLRSLIGVMMPLLIGG
ncbi:hypothetical protein F4779DRAFT_559880 [Xylariaceae sp. FL0662B]|nr:hypothetical protein F4779DRAFT_559880 [Xylariaceae sp. FL0662B]